MYPLFLIGTTRQKKISNMAAHWYALRTKPHKEKMVEHALNSVGIDAYLPLVMVNPVNPRSAKYRPFFPNYLFIHADVEQIGINTINWMHGVHYLVTVGDLPAIVPDKLVRQLQDRLHVIEKDGGLDLSNLHHGDVVRIKSGPLAGYEAIFDMRISGKERVQVLLSFLSQHPQRVQLDLNQIEKR